MTKYIALEDIINLIDSKIDRMEEYMIHNNLSPYMLDKVSTEKSILQQLKYEILKENIGEEFIKWLKENNKL